MANSRQEGRRPGIKKIFAELEKEHPTKPATEIAVMAKIEWTKRSKPTKADSPCPTCGHRAIAYPIKTIERAPYARRGHISSGNEKSSGARSARDSTHS